MSRVKRPIYEDDEEFDDDDLSNIEDSSVIEELVSLSQFPYSDDESKWSQDDPRFFKPNGQRKAAETIRQIKLCDAVKTSFAQGFFTNQPIVANKSVTDWHRLDFVLPIPPSLNQWTRVFKGKAHASPCSKAYMRESAKLMLRWGVTPTSQVVGVNAVFFGLPTGSDIDGRNKQLLDCMQGYVLFNDIQVRDLCLSDGDYTFKNSGRSVLPPRVCVTVKHI